MKLLHYHQILMNVKSLSQRMEVLVKLFTKSPLHLYIQVKLVKVS